MIVGGSGSSIELLKSEYPHLQYIHLPSFKVVYGKRYPAWLMIFTILPRIIYGIIREHLMIKKIIKENSINIIIADARYGLWHSGIPSYLITHQIFFQLPYPVKIVQFLINHINLLAMKRFDQVWIPDFAGRINLSGKLSHAANMPDNVAYTGPLSRFDNLTANQSVPGSYEILVVLSGPEPQRSVFEQMITKQLISCQKKSLIICGTPSVNFTTSLSPFCTKISWLSGEKLGHLILATENIICRSGYSTIMDLIALNKKAFLVPTPGQTEQEYLAQYLSEKGLFLYGKQEDFNLDDALDSLSNHNPVFNFPQEDLLDHIISSSAIIKNSVSK